LWDTTLALRCFVLYVFFRGYLRISPRITRPSLSRSNGSTRLDLAFLFASIRAIRRPTELFQIQRRVLATKERKERKDSPFRPLCFVLYGFFRGYLRVPSRI